MKFISLSSGLLYSQSTTQCSSVFSGQMKVMVIYQLTQAYGMHGVSGTSFGPPLKFFHSDFDCFSCGLEFHGVLIISKRVIKYQTLRTLFYGSFE